MSINKIFKNFVIWYPLVLFPIFLTQLYIGIGRPDALTGNPILLAGQMMFTGFYALNEFNLKRKDLYLFAAFASFIMIFFTFTRAAWLALLIGLAVSIYGYYKTSREN